MLTYLINTVQFYVGLPHYHIAFHIHERPRLNFAVSGQFNQQSDTVFTRDTCSYYPHFYCDISPIVTSLISID